MLKLTLEGMTTKTPDPTRIRASCVICGDIDLSSVIETTLRGFKENGVPDIETIVDVGDMKGNEVRWMVAGAMAAALLAHTDGSHRVTFYNDFEPAPA